MADRLAFDDDGTLDELVMSSAFVHLEHLGDGVYMLIVENDSEHVHLTVPVRRRRGVPNIIVDDHRQVPHTVGYNGACNLPCRVGDGHKIGCVNHHELAPHSPVFLRTDANPDIRAFALATRPNDKGMTTV